jgi:serine/threonine protein kinase
MIGATISHYQIIEKIGQGGMEEIYRARDTRVKREVAIKVSPATFKNTTRQRTGGGISTRRQSYSGTGRVRVRLRFLQLGFFTIVHQ